MNKSFTLIEILVVIVVIGIISAFILVGMSSISQKASIAKSQAFSNSLNNSLLLARVSEWNFNNLTGTVGQDVSTVAGFIKDSWLSNDGTAAGAPNLEESGCVTGRCLSFNGSTDYVDCGSGTGMDLTSAFTISIWINPSTVAAGSRTFFYRGNLSLVGGYAINQEANKLNGYFYDTAWRSTTVSATALVVGQWYYVTVTYNKSNLRLYVNGIDEQHPAFTTDINIGAGSVTRIGDAGSVQRFNGRIDDVRIYNQALSVSQVEQNYYSGLNKLLIYGNIDNKEYNNRIKICSIN